MHMCKSHKEGGEMSRKENQLKHAVQNLCTMTQKRNLRDSNFPWLIQETSVNLSSLFIFHHLIQDWILRLIIKDGRWHVNNTTATHKPISED